jgi:Ca2+-binding EF-hand superfamily protein
MMGIINEAFMSTLSKEEISEIRDHFEFFDRNHNDLLEEREFIQLFNILAPDASREMALRGFETIDTDGNGGIDFEEFLDWWQLNWTVF